MIGKTQQNASKIDVTSANFEQQVIAQSRQRLVVVDFWASWCGPCRVLGPTLEKLATEARGAFVLAKIDVDAEPRLAQRYGIQSIPAVKAFRDGRVVSEFVGAQPEAQIRRWLQMLAQARPAAPEEVEVDDPLEVAHAREAAGDLGSAQELYHSLFAEDPANAAALSGLLRTLLRRDPRQAPDLLRGVASEHKTYALAQQLLPLAETLAQPLQPAGNPALDEQYQAGLKAIQQGQWETALEAMLSIISRNRSYRDDQPRQLFVALLALLGDDNQLVPGYRRRLANTLF